MAPAKKTVGTTTKQRNSRTGAKQNRRTDTLPIGDQQAAGGTSSRSVTEPGLRSSNEETTPTASHGCPQTITELEREVAVTRGEL